MEVDEVYSSRQLDEVEGEAIETLKERSQEPMAGRGNQAQYSANLGRFHAQLGTALFTLASGLFSCLLCF
jgi:hypothetical protein